jgi:signal transduction histidine kinase
MVGNDKQTVAPKPAVKRQVSTGRSAMQQRFNDDFEVVTRRIRWGCIAAVALLFPVIWPRFWLIIALVVSATIYNFTRYSQRLLTNRLFASPLTMVVIDNVFVALLILSLGTADSPFSAMLSFTLVSVAYLYRLKGAIILTLVQSAWMVLVTQTHWFEPIVTPAIYTIILIMAVFLGIGFFIDQLTRLDHQDREQLRKLSHRRESELSHLLALINSLNSAVFIVSNDGKVLLFNEAARMLSGNEADLAGMDFVKAFPLCIRRDSDMKPVDLLKNSETSSQYRRDLCLLTKNNSKVDLEITVRNTELEGVGEQNYIVVCDDISRERSLDEQRAEFIAVASHELRTPIAIMEAALSMAINNKEPLPDTVRPLIEQAHDNSRYLADIIKDLSMIAEANNDNLPVEFQQLDVPTLIHHLADTFDTQAKQKGLDLVIDVSSDTPTVLSTERHVREILQNYLTNAIKYTPTGEVRLKAEMAKNGGVLFSVTDHGIGISPTDQKHLFTKFFRAEDYRTRQTGGTGLGLYLCQELAERLGGKVWCRSTINKGSTFYLQIPPFSSLRRDQGEVIKAQVSNLVDGL